MPEVIRSVAVNYEEFRQALLAWFNDHGRAFYWRENDLNPFHHLLTELLLKRTTAQTVDNYGGKVLDASPDPETVVAMNDEELVELLRPFGLYNRRSKNIRNVCRQLLKDHDGTVPEMREELLAINGIGEYTADAVRCFAFGKPAVLLDTNIATVAEEFFGVTPADDLRLDTDIRSTLQPVITEENPREINWALLDLGADLIAHDRGTEDYSIPDMTR